MADKLIAILDENGNELLSTMVNVGVSVAPSKTFARHSLENRQVIVDDQFDNPTSLSMQMILNSNDYVAVYQEIKSYYKKITNFTIQTRVDVYYNMFLESLPHDETPEMFDTIGMTLEFTEQLITQSDTVTLSESAVSNKSDASTVDAGDKNTTTDDGTVLQRMTNSVSSYFGGR